MAAGAACHGFLIDFSLNRVSDNDCEGLMKKFSMSFELIADARKNERFKYFAAQLKFNCFMQ